MGLAQMGGPLWRIESLLTLGLLFLCDAGEISLFNSSVFRHFNEFWKPRHLPDLLHSLSLHKSLHRPGLACGGICFGSNLFQNPGLCPARRSGGFRLAGPKPFSRSSLAARN
jgi:hypothetical protein